MKKYALLLVFIACTCIAQGQIISTIAGNGIRGAGGDGGMATDANVNEIEGIAVDATGNIYIAEPLNNRVRRITPAGVITTYAGNGAGASFGDGGAATAAAIDGPECVATDAAGNLYISEYLSNKIRKVNPLGIISTFVDTGLYSPQGICTDSAGNLYIADQAHCAVKKVSPAGVVSVIAGTGTGGYTGDGGPATAAQIERVSSVAVDAAGNVYISCWNHGCIRRVNPAGIINTVAGIPAMGYGGDGGPATAASFMYPTFICVDSTGNVYVGDVGNNRVRKINMATGIVTTVAGTDTVTYNGDGIPAVVANMGPKAVHVLPPWGDILLGDAGNMRLRKVKMIEPITGPAALCAGDTTTLHEGATGGRWSSSAPAAATVDSVTGLLTGIATGTATITYSIGANFTIHAVAVNPVADSGEITGSSSVCAGAWVALSETMAGGRWSSSDPAIAAIDSAGVVTGVSAGVVMIYYTVTVPCDTAVAAIAFTVNRLPDAGTIAGPSAVCVDSIIVMTDTVAGGSWHMTNASATEVAGLVRGEWPGTDTLLYTVANGCGGDTASMALTINDCTLKVPYVANGSAAVLQLSPNPTTGVVHVRNMTGATMYRLCNMPGFTVANGRLLPGENVIDMRLLPQGLYMLEVADEAGQRWLQKVVKE